MFCFCFCFFFVFFVFPVKTILLGVLVYAIYLIILSCVSVVSSTKFGPQSFSLFASILSVTNEHHRVQ